jgi:hypothetical protein
MNAERTIDLMDIIYKKNKVNIFQSLDISYKQKIESAIDQFRRINSDIQSLTTYLSLYEPNTVSTIDYKKENVSLKNTILSFIKRNAPVKYSDTELYEICNILFWSYIPLFFTKNNR